ncbi:MAG: GDP-mannose 4,6-dehydratase [Robiginitomaculum sp.]|nr:GDP-mannose 4,6-dehydratase [Robiginitomaculum sp.]
MSVKSLIVGVGGQDGWFLQQYLTLRDQSVWGLSRQYLYAPDDTVQPAINICDGLAVAQLINDIQPDHVYFLAAVHHSAQDSTILADDLMARSTAVHVDAPRHFLEAIRVHAPQARFFYAASSHLFAGQQTATPITEATPFAPVGIYAQTKLEGVQLGRHYRDQHGLFVCSGFLFNHESWRRNPSFLSRNIISSVAAILREQQSELVLHNLSAQVDWSFAADTVRAFVLMLQLAQPHDMVIASGQLHSVQNFAEIAFGAVGLNWRDYVKEEPSNRQKTDISYPLCGDSTKLRALTGWQPVYNFEQMIRLLIDKELAH